MEHKDIAEVPEEKVHKLHAEEIVAALIMVALCAITMLNVATRYLTNISFAFTEEMSIFLVVVMTFVGAATAFTRGHHLAITALVERLPARWQHYQQYFALGCGLVTFLILGWYAYFSWLDDFESDIVSPGLGMPQWWYTLALPVLCALICLRLVLLLRREYKRGVAATATQDNT